jgi:hypothetical protein
VILPLGASSERCRGLHMRFVAAHADLSIMLGEVHASVDIYKG